jgi:hypothetical protein
MGIFYHDGDSKIDTTPMEYMGHDACLIVGYHNKVSLVNPNEQHFPKWKTLLIMFSNFCKKALTTCFFRTLNFLTVKVQQWCIPCWNSQINRNTEMRLWNHQPSLELSGSFLGARCSCALLSFFVLSICDALRKWAGDHMEKFAESMKKSAQKRRGDEKVCEVGEVVHVTLKNEDKAKVDSGNLTGVIVKVDKTCCQVCVAVKSGLLKSWYVYHRLGRVTGKGNNVELTGLTDALKLNGWESMKIILEREAARKECIVGGQGKGDVACLCKGKCHTN